MAFDKLFDLQHWVGMRTATIGLDSPKESFRPKKDWHSYPIQNFDYSFNTWGFRGPEYDTLKGTRVNICLGDSFTVNLGGPIEHGWAKQLATCFDIPTINLAIVGASNDAIKLVYDQACKIFDVQNTFVMYTFLHRRLVNGIFEHFVVTDDDDANFKNFEKYRIPNAFECALPTWVWEDTEKEFLKSKGIYFFDIPLLFANFPKEYACKHINQQSYNNLKGPDWPTIKELLQGVEPHPDMFKAEYSNCIDKSVFKEYTNRDGYHMNEHVNKIYCDYLYRLYLDKS